MNQIDMARSGLTQSNRPIRLLLRGQGVVLDDVLIVKQVIGKESLCGGIDYQLLCLSTQAALPLKTFIALAAELQFVTDRGHLRSVCGIVARAHAGQSDGGLATYQLVIRDALSLMERRINTRVFRHMSETDIISALTREWRSRNPVLAGALDIEMGGIKRAYPAREFTMQYNESDAAFLRRLCKRRGISWFIRPASQGAPGSGGPPVHSLVLFDSSLSLARNAAGTVRFHRDAATEARDGIVNWSAMRTLVSGSVNRQSWDYRQGHMMLAQSPAMGKQGGAGDRVAEFLDDHRIEAPHIADNGDDYRLLGDVRMQRHEYEAKCFHGEGGVRDLCVGEWFRLEGHPEIDTHRSDEREFVVTEISVVAENNLASDLDEKARRLFAANGWSAAGDAALDRAKEERGVRYTNHFACVRRGTPIVPAYDPRLDLPRVHMETAIVVGPPGEEVHCDALGRIKLRFPGMREQDHPDGAGASNSDRDSAWIRISSHWASNGWGSLSLPRVGDEVVVDFLGGDPDKPIVIGLVHSDRAPPAAFSHAGTLPGNRFIAGIKSKEIRGTRSNQLRLDDTAGQISAQLASEHGHSQLNLGWLTHPRNNGEGRPRGEGAELRSDHAVVLRAARLMLLTTQAMMGAQGKQLEREPLQNLLESSQALLEELGAFAEQHQAMPVDASSHAQLATALRDAEQDGDTLTEASGQGKSPLIAHYAEGGFASVTPGSSVSYTGRQQNFVAQQHIQMVAGQRLNVNAGKGMSLFSHQDGMKHIARAGKLEIQAQQDSIGIAANRDVNISASQGEVVIAARKSLTLLCGGSYIKIAEGKLELGCAGDFTVKAGKHRWDGPAQQQVELPFFPAAEHTNWLKLDLDGHQGAPMAGVSYTLYFADGQQKGGTLDGNGMAEERNLPDAISKVVYHNSPSATDESRPTVDDLLVGLDPLLAQGASAAREPGGGRER